MLKKLFLISRPRFWLYVVGSYLIGVGGALSLTDAVIFNTDIIWWLIYFTLPANLFIYGINDLADEDTDQYNQKKDGYEVRVKKRDKKILIFSIILLQLIFIPLFLKTSSKEIIALLIFFILNILYSLPPTRLKAIPFLDSISNGIICAAIGYMGYISAGGQNVLWLGILAGFIWSASMHAFSAIPDIKADIKGGIRTIATVLGKIKTQILCLLSYILILLIFIYSKLWLHLLLVLPYIILISFGIKYRNSDEKIFRVYMIFPFVTYIVGYLVYLFNTLI